MFRDQKFSTKQLEQKKDFKLVIKVLKLLSLNKQFKTRTFSGLVKRVLAGKSLTRGGLVCRNIASNLLEF